MLIDVHLPAVRNDFDRLPSTRDGHRRLIDCLLWRIRRRNRRIVMKTFLNLFWQLDEVNSRDSRLASEHNAIGFDVADRDVLVFFALNGLEVVSQRDWRGA